MEYAIIIWMKRAELVFNIASIPVDIISLLFAGLVSFYFRLQIAGRLPILFSLDLNAYLRDLFISVPIMIGIFALAGLYNLKGTRKFSPEFLKVLISISISLLLVIIIFFFNQRTFPSRLIILTAWALGIIFVVMGRYILRKVQVLYLSRGYGLRNLAIIDGPGSELNLIDEIKNNKHLGYRVVAVLENSSEMLEQLHELYNKNQLEEILQANPALSQDINLELVQFARNRGLYFSFVPNLFEVQRNVVETETINGIPYISLKNTPLEGWGRVVKRIFDIIAASVCLILTSPLFLVISILIKLDSSGRILYAAPRVGSDREFTFYKFRTMYSHLSVGEGYGGQEAQRLREQMKKNSMRQGPIPKFKDDPRITAVGKFLRRTKLDEIPQFLNVLKGDMSMVGPRAHVLDEVQRYRDKYRRVFTIKPGIFGLAQLSQISRPELPFEEEMRLNIFYIDNWSLWIDIGILGKSFYYLFFVEKPKEIF